MKTWVLLFAALIAGIIFVSAASADVIIICNRSVEEDTLSKKAIDLIFLGKKTRWSDDQKIHFAVLEDGDMHKAFLKKYINKTESQYDLYWKRMVFTGKGKSPKTFKTVEEMIRYVASTQGAVGYIGDITGKTADILAALAMELRTINENTEKTIRIGYLLSEIPE